MSEDAAVTAIAVTCSKCGAGLELPQGARFVTCTYCGARLELHRSGGAAYTQILDSIEQHTERIAGDVEQIRRENELERLDREWMISREQLMVTNKHGARHVPGKFGALIGAGVAAVFGIFWTVGASAAGAPPLFTLFGVVFVLLAIGGGVYAFSQAGEYEQAEAAYRRRRAELLTKVRGGE